MRLVSLNIFGGKIFDKLANFIKSEAKKADIFFFQELFQSFADNQKLNGTKRDIVGELKKILPGFDLFLAPIGDGYNIDLAVGEDFDITEYNAIFVRTRTIPKINSAGSVFTFGLRRKLTKGEATENVPANFQYIRLAINGKKFSVCNVHGIWAPGNKLDTPERLRQSQIIAEFLSQEKGSKIVCGDFNLLPETKSIKILEQSGLVNLIKEFKIEKTRSRLSPYWGTPDFQKFADFAFVSPGVQVLEFTVPDVEVSDHLPMILDFS